jgi:hypothetical protein
VNGFAKPLLVAIFVLALAGCAAPLLSALTGSPGSSSPAPPTATAGAVSITIPPSSIFDEAEPSTKMALMSPAALLEENGQLDLAIMNEQCKFRSPDPPFLVPSEAAQKGWIFAGRLNDDGKLREMESMEYRSFFGFGWSKQQLNSWPLGMTTLSEMPESYLDERLTVLSNAKLAKEQQDSLAQRYVDDSRKIQERVARLEKTYNPEAQCIEPK